MAWLTNCRTKLAKANRPFMNNHTMYQSTISVTDYYCYIYKKTNMKTIRLVVLAMLGASPVISNCQSINPQVIWSTYFGSDGDDYCGEVVTDQEDNIYFVSTDKGGAPVTAGTHSTLYGGGTSDAMLTKFDKNGKLIWSTYFGGSGTDEAWNLALAPNGTIIMTGYTNSVAGIATIGAHNALYNGLWDGFIAAFDRDGKLKWSTYFGGYDADFINDVSIDTENSIYIVGSTKSLNAVATDSCYQYLINGKYDGFIAKFDIAGKILWSTYYGGSENDYLYAVENDSENNVFIGGTSYSEGLASPNAFKINNSGDQDGLVLKFNKTGQRVWASYFGSSGADLVNLLGIDDSDQLYVMGTTTSTDNIATNGAFSSTHIGKEDLFISRFSNTGTQLWSTYLGGDEWDTLFGCDFDQNNNLYLSVMSKSTNFPVTKNVLGPLYHGGTWDAVFTKIDPLGNVLWSTYLGGNDNDRAISMCLDSDQNLVATINCKSTGLASAGAFDTICSGFETLLIKMKDLTIVDVNDLNNLSALEVFPNPFADYVEIPNSNSLNRNIAVFDAKGSLVLRFLHTNASQFKMGNLQNGSYYLLVEDLFGQKTAKIIKLE